MRRSLPLLAAAVILPLLAPTAPASAAPYVNAAAARDRFGEITAEDMEMLRTRKILLLSRSFGLNLCKGLGQLAKQDAEYRLRASHERHDVFKTGSDLGIIPADASEKRRFVHAPITHRPLTERCLLHLYADRDLPHPFLKAISPAIGACVKREELLLNNSDLSTFPEGIARLQRIKTLSLANNRLANLRPRAQDWAEQFDPRGLGQQRP